MKIVKFNHGGNERFGSLIDPQTVRAMSGSPFEGPIELTDESWPLADLELLAPTVAHPRIFGIGLNYKSHILETGR
uniref:DUF2437 domain-containing protein n=1 Tax=Hydrogenophaga sp. TaxID=1904254 RepID=UPI003563336A